MKSALLLALILQFGCIYAGAAMASNPLGFYVGASVGRSDVRSTILEDPEVGNPTELIPIHANDIGWKLVLGLRPIPIIAAELAYTDFGDHASRGYNLGNAALLAIPKQSSVSASGLLFAPIPLPLLDLYARAGVALLHSGAEESLYCTPLGAENFCTSGLFSNPYSFGRSNTDFLYGAGVQLKFSALAVRIEYERINDSRGSPDLASAGVLWRF